MIRITRCPLCGSGAVVPFGAAGGKALHFFQVRCAGCDLLIAQPQASDAEVDSYYRSHYYEERWSDADRLFDENRSAQERFTVPALLKLCGPLRPGTALEIGCGYGAMLATLATRGHRAFGLDLSHRAAVYGRSRGVRIAVARFPDVPARPGSFDLVIARHVIEHVRDPRAFVAALVGLTKIGGTIVIETENAVIAQHAWDRFRARVAGRVPPFRSSTDHTFVFQPRHLESLLTEAGCSAVRSTSFTELPERESLHWHLYKATFRAIDRLRSGGEYLMAAGRRSQAGQG